MLATSERVTESPGQITPAGTIPRLKAFTVVGVFEAGHYEFDSGMAFIHLSDAQKFFRQEGPSGVRLKIKDMLRDPIQQKQLIPHLKNLGFKA